MEAIEIRNFKCFNEISIPVNLLTVMAGANGNGKSTSLQALLLLRKTIEENCKLYDGFYITERNELNEPVALNNGYLLTLGNSSILTNRNSADSKIKISILGDKEPVYVEYLADGIDPKLFLLAERISELNTSLSSILKKEFYYLNAERIGPRVSQQVQYYEYPNAGFQGENVANLIADTNYRFEIDELRKHPKTASPRLEQQLNAWLDDLMPGVRVIADQSFNTLTSQIRVENYYTQSDPTIAPNIGFGISYVLPILATGLIAEKGSFLIIENPEAHLHPSAQSKIGRFLAMVAMAGVKVIIETHSDHVINGIQIAVAKHEISSDDVVVNFFSQQEGEIQPKIESIFINSKGELSKWPRGFFDQAQIDFAELFKLRKG